MSTYTDLHNRVKEGIAVDAKTRTTPQQVKMLNEQNEYWGTFVGTLSTKDVAINGGTIKNAVIENTELRHVKGLDGLDLDNISTTIHQISADLYESALPNIETKLSELDQGIGSTVTKIGDLSNTLSPKITAVSNDITELSSKLSTIMPEAKRVVVDELQVISGDVVENLNSIAVGIVGKMSEISNQLSDRIDYLYDTYAESADVSVLLDELSVDLGRRIDDQHATMEQEYKALLGACENVSKQSISADEHLMSVILSVETASQQIDGTIRQQITAEVSELTKKIEHDRHAILIDPTMTWQYPLSVVDFAVNTFYVDLPTAFVYSTEGEDPNNFPIGYICSTSQAGRFPLTFKTYDLAGHYENIALDSNKTYAFSDQTDVNDVKNGYQIVYRNDETNPGFSLTSTTETYFDVYFGNVVVGKVTNTLSDDTGVLSGRFSFVTAGIAELSGVIGAQFDFNTSELSTWRSPTGSSNVIYEGNNRFEIRTNISDRHYFMLTDSQTPYTKFGMIYEGTGIVYDHNDDIVQINAVIASPVQTTAELCASSELSTNFRTVLSSTGHSDIVLSCDISDNQLSAKFGVVEVAEQIGYKFYSSEITSPAISDYIGAIILPSSVTRIDDQPIDVISVDMSESYILDEFNGVWELHKSNDGVWRYNTIDQTTLNSLIIGFDGTTLSVDSVEFKKSAVINRRYAIDWTTKYIANENSSVTGIYETDYIPFAFDSSIPEYDVLKPAIIYSKEKTTGGKPIRLDIHESTDNTIKLMIPPKTGDLSDVSRQFKVRIRVNRPGVSQIVDLKFVDANDNVVTVINQRMSKIQIKTNEWTTLQFDELPHNEFLVTDLDANDDDWKIESLSSDISALQTNLSELSGYSHDNINLIADHISRTFVSTDKSADQTCVFGDNLILADVAGSTGPQHEHQRYYMTFESGTIVLKPLT